MLEKVLTNIHKKDIIVTQWKYNIKISRKEGDSVEIGCTVRTIIQIIFYRKKGRKHEKENL